MSINDLDIQNWRQYQGDITTDALWISGDKDKFQIPDRGYRNNQDFHGIFIHEIVYQMLRRYTKKKDIVWDCFGGSGTTYRVCKDLDRECVINDLSPTQDYIVKGDSATFSPEKKVQMVFMHPPYWDIVKYGQDQDCLSQKDTLNDFLNSFKKIVENVDKYLESGRYLILVCGYVYKDKEIINLGEQCKELIRNCGYRCKGHIIKDYGETKGGHKQKANLEYYRALKYGYYKFPGDNIYVLEKK